MAYLDYPGLAYFKSLLDQTYLRVDYDGDTTIAGHVTFTNPITGDIDGRAKKDWLDQQFDTTYLKDIQPDESGALKLILGNGQVSHLVTDTTVTQERSSANETYPILLCYDENATANQIAKKVKYGHDVQINPAYGYIYAQGYVEKHPAYNRTTTQSSRAEWMLDFRDSVLNPVGQIYSYIDPSGQGGEHRMEFRLYGNPHTTSLNLPNYNFETDTVSLGVSSTKGDKLTFFGYAPSTPIYLENGTTMRKSTVRGDQYGRDIITRDWLNLNGSITGLVHTYMDETIDGYKTFLKTVTIDSGNDNAKAGLNVQGDVNIDSGDASKPSNFYVQGNSHIHGNEDIDGNLNVDGTSDQHGNVHMYHNLDVDGNANTDGNQTIGGTLTVTGKITGNGGAEISGGSGLKVNGNETVTGNLGVGGTINKVSGNTTQEYVTYVTNQADTRKNIAQNLVDTSRGVGYDASTGKIYAKIDTTQGLKFSSSGAMQVDFSDMPTDKFEALLKALKMLIPLTGNKYFHVNNQHANKGDSLIDNRGTENLPFETIQACVNYASSTYSLGKFNIYIDIHPGTYNESIVLGGYATSGGGITLRASDPTNKPILRRVTDTHHTSINASNNVYSLAYLKFVNYAKDTGQDAGSARLFSYVIASRSNAIVNIYGCDIEHKAIDSANSRLYLITVSAEGGAVNFRPDANYTTTLNYDKGTYAYHTVLNADRGNISFAGTDNSSDKWQIPCQGDCDVFADAHNSCIIGPSGSGTYHMKFVVASGKTCTGKRHSATNGGGIINNQGDDYPGDVEGTAQASTYSWYRE